MTDTFGVASFDKFKIRWGPEGLYEFKAVTTSGQRVYSDTWSIFLKSEVASIEPLNEFNTNFELGVTLSVQP